MGHRPNVALTAMTCRRGSESLRAYLLFPGFVRCCRRLEGLGTDVGALAFAVGEPGRHDTRRRYPLDRHDRAAGLQLHNVSGLKVSGMRLPPVAGSEFGSCGEMKKA